MKKIVSLFILFLTLASCGDFEDLEFKKFQGFQVDKIEGSSVYLNVNFEIYNPNKFTLSLKPSDLDIFADEVFLGKVYLLEKVKLIKRTTGVYSAPVKLELENGQMVKLLSLAMKPTVNIMLKGKVKGGIGIFSKRMEIEESREIKGADLKLGSIFGK